MDKVLVLVVTHRGIAHETNESIRRLNCPSQLVLKGSADQSKARSQAFDKALAATEGTGIHTILAIDDDMIFDPGAVLQLVDTSREKNEPVSGVAVQESGQLCARPLNQLVLIPGDPVRWLTGLAFMAIPRERMVKLQPRVAKTAGITEWCRSGPHPDFPREWLPNDFWFCWHWGGVLLAPIAVGHLKMVPLWPEEAAVRELTEYQAWGDPRGT